MTKVLWVTDPHLDFVHGDGAAIFGDYLRKENPEAGAVLVTGDIGEFNTFPKLIERFAQAVAIPVWFVFGNHDAYRGSVHGARSYAAKVAKGARWLSGAGVVPFGTTALVGQDGWYDGRLGEGAASSMLLHDFSVIKELREHFETALKRLRGVTTAYGALPERVRQQSLTPLVREVSRIADEEAKAAKVNLEAAVAQGYKKVVFATHVPPFAGAAWHLGKPSDPDALPWFASKVMGETLLEVAQGAPEVDFLVLCGHSHSPGEYQAAPNMRVVTGKAVYKAPDLAGVFDWT